MSKEEVQFEKASSRLEEILEQMNTGELSLDKSLSLYEEADKLIFSCNKRLNEAEQKNETLIKKRNGELAIDTEGSPIKEEFDSSSTTNEKQ